jgi:hypothetical protein
MLNTAPTRGHWIPHQVRDDEGCFKKTIFNATTEKQTNTVPAQLLISSDHPGE